MLISRRLSIPALAVVCLCCAAPALAQRGRGGHPGAHPAQPPAQQHEAPLEQFRRMSVQQRESELAKLPADRRAKLQRQLQHYDQLTADQKEQLDWFSHLPAERQDAFRKAYKKFRSEPVERQQSMREEMGRLRSMPEADRNARLASSEVQSRFNKSEKQILSQMSDVLPHE